MSSDYRVDLTVGPYSWVVRRGEAPVFPAGVDVLDGLSVGWSMPETDLWPAQPNPTTAKFSLLAPSSADFDLIDTNTPVTLLIYAGLFDPLFGLEIPSVTFVGRVAELTGTPAFVAGQNAWRLDIQCVDLIADLADENIAGFNVDPDEYASPYGWIWGYFTYCDLPPPDWTSGTNTHSTLANPLVKMPPATLLEAVDNLLTRYADAGDVYGDSADPANHTMYNQSGWRRGILVPNITYPNVIDPVAPYRVEWVSRRSSTNAWAPAEGGRLVRDPDTGVWSVEMGAPTPPHTWNPLFEENIDVYNFAVVIDAAYLDRGATWSRSKFLDPNRIVLTAISGSEWNVPDNWRKAVRTTQRPAPASSQRVTAQLPDVRVIDPDDAKHVGDMYVADAYDNTNNRYEAESFIWYASSDPQWPIYRGLFPERFDGLFRGFSLPITLTGIPPEQSPNGARWYTGTLKGATWTFDRGEFVIGLSLYPRIPRPSRPGLLIDAPTDFTYIGLAALADSPTWEDIDPADTWMDYRLVRPLGTDYPTGP